MQPYLLQPSDKNLNNPPPLGQVEHYPEPIQEKLAGFCAYLIVRRDRAISTADSYRHDAVQYIEFYRRNYDDALATFTVNPNSFIAFSDMLKRNPCLRRSTIKRRLIGVHRFWGYLYRQKFVEYPPISMDEMDIVVKKITNPTRPVGPERFSALRKAARNGLGIIH